ncbi:MAG: sulfatase [Candidatus Hydrogenedentes bacterium]|nr:sulfatase [Candidatus Hydrogenedentota bacterium]
MNRRDALRTTAAATVAALGSAQFSATGAATRRPNVLLFHCHDLGQFLHCYGVKTVRTPNIDAFAIQGVRFSSSFCTAPQCSPSRASMFTGRYPHNNGVMGLCHADFAWDLRPEERHLAQFLGDAGYACESIGVVHETSSGPKRCGYEKHINTVKVSEVATAAITRLEHFAKDEKRPFFLCAGSIEPHRLRDEKIKDYMGFLSPEFGPDSTEGIEVPPFLRDTEGTRAELAELQGAVHHVDEHFGRILSSLRALGLEENTLVIFTTDHGYAMPRAKCSLYDPGLAIALLLRLPSRKGWHGGRVNDAMITNLDYLPTILDLAGIPVPANVQGCSFAPLLDGRDYSPRDAIFCEISHHDYYDPRRCVRTASHKLIVNFSSAPSFMDPSQSWRPRADTVVPESHALAYHKCVELYDLLTDPLELRDIADAPENTQLRQGLLARLRRHLVETNDPICREAIMPPLHRKSLRLMDIPDPGQRQGTGLGS